jgi:putative CocE/NonD family hydrolase
MSGWLNGDKINNPGGALHWMLILTWMLHEATQQNRSLDDFDIEELFKHIPLKDTMASIGIDDPIFSNPDTLETAWYDYSAIQIPVFHITGWYDFIRPGALTVYNEVSANTSALQRLMVGPWVHDQIWTTYTECGDVDFGERAAMGIDRINGLAVRWFDRWLKDEASGIEKEPAVEVFVMGKNEWFTFDTWPPRDLTYHDWYIDGGGHANTLDGNGVLASSLAEENAAHDTYVFDPMDPVPTMGGANFHFFPDILGIKDQRHVEEREDVLVYTSEPLEAEMIICGPVRVVVYASTLAEDTDFTAKLVEVRSDGYAANIVEGITRASLRNSLENEELLQPGEIYEIEIDLGATATAIPAGHRLRLEVSSSNFPKYDRNPNTGEHPWEAVEYQKTTQTIYHDKEKPSRVILPVLTGGSGGH